MLDEEKRRQGKLWIRNRLREIGLSQLDVANRIDVLGSTISRFVNGERELPNAKFVAFCTTIGVTPEVVLREMGYDVTPLPPVPVVGVIGPEGKVTAKELGTRPNPVGHRAATAYVVDAPRTLLHGATVFVGEPKKAALVMNRTCIFKRSGSEVMAVLDAAALRPGTPSAADALTPVSSDPAPETAAPVLFVMLAG